MSQKRDYYEILGLDKSASFEQIKKAYRQLAIKHHPDRNPDNQKESEHRFKEISEAYEVLSDPRKKETYDRYGHAGLKGAFGGGGFDWSNFSHFEDLRDIFGAFGFEDIFGAFGFGGMSDAFGGSRGGGSRGRPRRGSNIQNNLEVTLEEVHTGIEKTISVDRYETCESCSGSGAKDDKSKKRCPACGGRGNTVSSAGFFSISQTCSRCRGEGEIIKTPCPKCGGSGKIRVQRRIKVKIPAGIESGMHLKVSGEGNAGDKGGPGGDLYVSVRVKEHAIFERSGNDIICSTSISFACAALGTDLEVPTLDGRGRIKIPAGTQPGTVFKLKSKGLPSLRGYGTGDELIRVNIEVPKNLTERQKKAVRGLAESFGEDAAKFTASLKDKIKKVFE
jgi:molecular chaperone DnaJ